MLSRCLFALLALLAGCDDGSSTPRGDGTDASTDATDEAPPDGARSPFGRSLRFFGGNYPGEQISRIRISLDPNVPANVGASDFTVEWWMRTSRGSGTCAAGPDNWIQGGGTIVVDQDVLGPGDRGDYGVSIAANGQLAFGVAVGDEASGICSTARVTDGEWHHVAVTRNATSGELRIFVDGRPSGQGSGPPGDASYRSGRSGAEADRYLTVGGEKHAYEGYPWYDGDLDELRLSVGARYTGAFDVPERPFTPDDTTAALYHFDEPSGTRVVDASEDGSSPGTMQIGGTPASPQRTSEVPR